MAEALLSKYVLGYFFRFLHKRKSVPMRKGSGREGAEVPELPVSEWGCTRKHVGALELTNWVCGAPLPIRQGLQVLSAWYTVGAPPRKGSSGFRLLFLKNKNPDQLLDLYQALHVHAHVCLCVRAHLYMYAVPCSSVPGSFSN